MTNRFVAVVALIVSLSGCATDAAPSLSEPVSPTTTVVADTSPTVEVGAAREVPPTLKPTEEPVPRAAAETAPELDAEQIVTATVLIASGGDLEASITAGIIGEAEAEAALAALESGSIAELLD